MKEIFKKLGIEEVNSGAYCGEWLDTSGEIIEVFSPIDDSLIAKVKSASVEDYDTVSKKAQEDFKTWKMIPAPKRGEIIRQIGLELRKYKDELGKIVTIEMGKIHTEGLGEVQEMIDMADFAVGLSRQLYGNTMMSERPNHRMYEQWHPLGVIGIISAFNFPVAVWAWNAFIAGVCGDTMIQVSPFPRPFLVASSLPIINWFLPLGRSSAGIDLSQFSLVFFERSSPLNIAPEPLV